MKLVLMSKKDYKIFKEWFDFHNGLLNAMEYEDIACEAFMAGRLSVEKEIKKEVDKIAEYVAEKNSGLTQRALDDAEVCDCGEKFPESGYCRFCGARSRHRQ